MSEATSNAAQGGATRFQFRPGKPILSQSDADNGMIENALLMGIDLGTSRSSIVSMNGVRKTVESYVGWPKDPVSRKLLKTDIVYGKAALDNRLALDLYRPMEKGVIKGIRAKAARRRLRQEPRGRPARWSSHLVDLVEPRPRRRALRRGRRPLARVEQEQAGASSTPARTCSTRS